MGKTLKLSWFRRVLPPVVIPIQIYGSGRTAEELIASLGKAASVRRERLPAESEVPNEFRQYSSVASIARWAGMSVEEREH